jgi:DNA mismatch endonuclease (patch repair protein)
MSTIRKQDTRPELVVRRFLHSKGLRYPLYDRKLPGGPDAPHANDCSRRA